MNSAWLASLRGGDADAWRRFLADYHDVFRRAVGIGLWRLGRQATSAERRSLLVEAMKCCHRDLRDAFPPGSGRQEHVDEHRGEGRFRAYMFYTVVKSLHQQPAVSGSTTRSKGEPRPGLRWQGDGESAATEGLDRLRECVLRLPPSLRSILLFYHLEPDPPSLKEIAQVLAQDGETVRDAHRRGLLVLSAAVSDESESAVDPALVERGLEQLRCDAQDVGDREASRAQVWRLSGGELTEADRTELEPRVAARVDALRELAVADCLLAGGDELPLQTRLEVADEVLRSAGAGRGIRPFHGFVLAVAVLIGVLMLFDDGQPVTARIVAFELQQLGAGQPPETPRDCEFRVELSSRHDRNVALLMAHMVDGARVVRRLFPPPPPIRKSASSSADSANPIRAGEGMRIPPPGNSPFRCPWMPGTGLLVVSSDPAEVLSESVLQGLIATAQLVLDEGGFDSSTYRRLIKALIESAQHDSVAAHVHWIDLRAPSQ